MLERLALRRIHNYIKRVFGMKNPELAEPPEPLELVERQAPTTYLELGLPGQSLYAEWKSDWRSHLIPSHSSTVGQWLPRFQAVTVAEQQELSDETVEEYIRVPRDGVL